MLRKQLATISAILCLVSANAAQADTISIGTLSSGWYDDTDVSLGPANLGNYFSGDEFGIHYRNFFTFDLSALAGATITGASLQLYTYDMTDSGSYSTYDVSTAPATLTAGGTVAGAYNDLGTGALFGSVGLATTDANSLIVFNLLAAAVTAIQNAAGGTFAIGGDFIGDNNVSDDYAFGFSEANAENRLIVEYTPGANVPDGGITLGLLGGAMMALGMLRRRFL